MQGSSALSSAMIMVIKIHCLIGLGPQADSLGIRRFSVSLLCSFKNYNGCFRQILMHIDSILT